MRASLQLYDINLTDVENRFVDSVAEDVQKYILKDERTSVIVFPALHKRFRFLIHKVIELFPRVTSFSIGEGWCRRTIVCFPDNLNCNKRPVNLHPTRLEKRFRQDMDRSKQETGKDQAIEVEPKNSNSKKSQIKDKTRRPDIQVYVPRARRTETRNPKDRIVKPDTPKKTVVTSASTRSSINEEKSSKLVNLTLSHADSSNNISTEQKSNPPSSKTNSGINKTSGTNVVARETESLCQVQEFTSLDKSYSTDDSSTVENTSGVDSSMSYDVQNMEIQKKGTIADDKKSESVITPMQKNLSADLEKDSRSSPVTLFPASDAKTKIVDSKCSQSAADYEKSKTDRVPEYSSNIVESAAPESEVETSRSDVLSDDDSWDTLFDESGECLNPDQLKELDQKLGKVKLKTPKINYLSFTPNETDLSTEEFQHILELYDFPAEFKTQDLIIAFSQFKDKGFDIKWVDDTHALAVFSNASAASCALSMNNAFIKTRPLSEAIEKSKQKARHCSEFLLPYKPRPQTSAALARRLVTGALGIQSPTSNKKQLEEKRQLKEAKEKKKQAAQQRQNIWDGKV